MPIPSPTLSSGCGAHRRPNAETAIAPAGQQDQAGLEDAGEVLGLLVPVRVLEVGAARREPQRDDHADGGRPR
jgi:hypothetical protein